MFGCVSLSVLVSDRYVQTAALSHTTHHFVYKNNKYTHIIHIYLPLSHQTKKPHLNQNVQSDMTDLGLFFVALTLHLERTAGSGSD